MRTRIQTLKPAVNSKALAVAQWIIANIRVLIKHGPLGNVQYARFHRGRSSVHVFGQGLTSSIPVGVARQWFLARGKPFVIALVGIPTENIGDWLNRVRRGGPDIHFLIAPEAIPFVEGIDPSSYSLCPALGQSDVDFFMVKDWMAQYRAKWDLLLLDVAQSVASLDDMVMLQYAAYSYDRGQHEIGFVSPALRIAEHRVLGYEWDRDVRTWVSRRSTDDYGQHAMPRYVLAANAHGLYATHRALSQVTFGSSDAHGHSIDEQVRRMIAGGWRHNIRTLALPFVELAARELPVPTANDFDREWLADRVVVDPKGRRRIIFVLTGTSISGGIRTVFEQADGFVKMGFEVEIWALDGQPDWFDLHVRVKTFGSYFDMIPALRNEDAIKVATWWETAEVVWLGSVNRGIAVNYAQEFETWFYPEDEIARAAVASSYRREMSHLTIASFQQEELAGVGIPSTYIPSCFDARKFGVLPDIRRRDDTVMAVGRSFFQKNFAMTASAWLSLGDQRPLLSLFGFEPDILVDERVQYEVRPSDERVNEMYNAASVFVQTSVHEGFCLPLIEAMAAGCPVITTDSHGNRDFCRDGENCIIVEQGDVEGLAEAIRTLMGDPALRARLAAAGVATAANYSQDVVFRQLEAFYNGLT